MKTDVLSALICVHRRPQNDFVAHPWLSRLLLSLLGLTLAFAIGTRGAVWPRDWNICVLAIVAIVAVHRLCNRTGHAPPLSRPSQALPLAFAALVAVQLLPLPPTLLQVLSPARAALLAATGPVLGTAAAPLSVAPAATLEHLVRLASYLLVFLLVRDLAWRPGESPWLPVLPLIPLAALEAVLGLLQSYTQGSAVFATGTWVNHNHFAGFLELCLPFAVLYPVSRLQRPLKSCPVLTLAALILLAILQSQSRMGFLATLAALLAIGCLALSAKRKGWKRWLPIAAFALLVALGFLFLPGDPLIARYGELSPPNAISSDMRVGMWRDTLGLIRAFPLFGCGLGAFESAFPPFQTVAPMNTIDFAHNDYLQYLAELGAPSFVVGLLFLLGIFRQAIRAAMDPSLGDRRYLALACAGAFTAIALHSLVDFNLYIPSNAMLLAWIAGIAAVPVHASTYVVKT